MTKYCNRYPFEMMTGCPSIEVNLSFPTLDYCASVEFPAIDAPVLKIPVVKPAPDVSDEAARCIEITPAVNARFNPAKPTGQQPSPGATFYVPRRLAAMSDEEDEPDCGEGRYRLDIDLPVACPLGGIPNVLRVWKPDRTPLGEIKFNKSTSDCRLDSVSAKLNLVHANNIVNALGIHPFVPPECIFDDGMNGTVNLANVEKPAIRFNHENCKAETIVLDVPVACYSENTERINSVATSVLMTIEKNIPYGGFDVKAGVVSCDIPVLSVDMHYYNVLPNIVSMYGMPGVKVEQTIQDGVKYRISVLPLGVTGPTGDTGPTGPEGDLLDCVTIKTTQQHGTGKKGETGPTGSRGDPGVCPVDPVYYIGFTGPDGRDASQGDCAGHGVCTCPHNLRTHTGVTYAVFGGFAVTELDGGTNALRIRINYRYLKLRQNSVSGILASKQELGARDYIFTGENYEFSRC